MKNIRTKWMSVCKGKIVHGMKNQILNYKKGIKLYPTVLLVLAILSFSFTEALAIEKDFSSSDDVYVASGPGGAPGAQIEYLNDADNIPNHWTVVKAGDYSGCEEIGNFGFRLKGDGEGKVNAFLFQDILFY